MVMVDTDSVTSVTWSLHQLCAHVSLHVCHLDRAECESLQGLFCVLAAGVCCLFALPLCVFYCHSPSHCGCILILIFHISTHLKLIRPIVIKNVPLSLFLLRGAEMEDTQEYLRWRFFIRPILPIENVLVIRFCIETTSPQQCIKLLMLTTFTSDCFLIHQWVKARSDYSFYVGYLNFLQNGWATKLWGIIIKWDY